MIRSLILLTCMASINAIYLRMPPKYQKEIDKLNTTEDKVRKQIKVQQGDLDEKRSLLKKDEDRIRKEMKEVSYVEDWLRKAQKGLDRIAKAKESVHVQYDLERLRPFVKLAASKREKLKQESERVGSAHKQVSDRVTELENQLKNLRANVTEKQEDAVKDKENSSTISSTGSSSSSSSSNEVDKKEEEEELKTASGSIDDLLKELDDGR